MALSKDAKEMVRLGDLCQVVPRGRVLQVLVGEKEVCASSLCYAIYCAARQLDNH